VIEVVSYATSTQLLATEDEGSLVHRVEDPKTRAMLWEAYERGYHGITIATLASV
jgi:hypothetical protein